MQTLAQEVFEHLLIMHERNPRRKFPRAFLVGLVRGLNGKAYAFNTQFAKAQMSAIRYTFIDYRIGMEFRGTHGQYYETHYFYYLDEDVPL